MTNINKSYGNFGWISFPVCIQYIQILASLGILGCYVALIFV